MLLKEAFFYSASKAVPGIVGLASVILFIRIFGSSEYGKYSLLLSQCNLIVAIVFGWLNQSQLRYYSIDSLNSEYRTNQLRALSFCTLICIIILSILMFFQTLSKQIWIISLMTVIAIGFFNYLKTIYQVKLLPVKIIFMTSVQSLLGLLAPILLFVFGWSGEITILLGVGFSFLIVLLLSKLFDKNNLSLEHINNGQDKNSNALIKKWFSYGTPLSLWFAAGMALPFLDRLFINQFLTSDELGIYSGLQELLTRIYSLILFPLILAVHPRIMNLWNDSNFHEVVMLIKKSIRVFLFIGAILLFIVMIFNDFIFSMIQKAIPQVSNQNKELILPLLFSGFLWQLSFITHKMLELKEKTMFMVLAIFPSIVINIIGNSIFLPRFGQLATANTALLSALTYCTITFVYSIHSMNRVNKI